jgi:uncharacterized membrane protein required for colicin V production
LLDILLGLVVLLFVPFGIRRGVAKEAMVSAGILLGTTLAERFGQVWGAELALRFRLESGAATFAASAILLFGCTFLLGYGGGAALGASRPGTLSRLVGGLLAAFNAALLLSYLLSWIEGMLAQGAILDDGILSEALLRQANLLLLAAAGVLLILTVAGWMVNAARSRRQPREQHAALLAGMPARQRPVRVAAGGDVGKYEPGAEPVARSGRFGQGIGATSPLPSPNLSGSEPWANDRHSAHTSNGKSLLGQGDGLRRTPDAPYDQRDETVWAAWSAPASDEPYSRTEPASQWPAPSSLGVTEDARCAVCRARVGPRDVFCPECGATL